MKVVILCGGQGTRIRDVSDNLPKPMIPVGGLPILWHIMKYYATWGHKDFVLCLGYMGKSIKDFFLNYEQNTRDFSLVLGGAKSIEYHTEHKEADWRVTLAETGLDALTGARIKRIRKYIGDDENFMLTYGDGVGDINIDELLKFHQAHGKILTVTGVRPPGRFGELMHAPDGQVTEFNEKPQATGGRISGGYFVCRRDIFDYLDDREDLTFETDPMRKLVADGQMMVFEHDGFWQPMDTYRDYSYLNNAVAINKAPWIKW
ncbi:glucose-1-phosphate cytidylyltransferase [Herbaspirillum sp. NPDC101397]|uniref:glucose-1-phosphate cytidylyltransferase n=1 Tax=Herbaspirillum sp. NPDC101397 TaxID=3364006 RepID=UPI00383BD8DF